MIEHGTIDDTEALPLYARTRAAADRLSLVHTSDDEAGIVRKRAGRGFYYVDERGRRLGDPVALKRIRALAIPPAWTDVWISPSEDGHIQATGRDQKGRKQYRYHEQWATCRDEVKFGSLATFARSLPMLRTRIDADLRRRGLPFERVAAAVVWLLDNTMIRVGNSSYARENGSYGLTTLRDRHVDVTGNTLRFAFKGKSGKEWHLSLRDRRIARIVKGAQDIPGQHLFQYLDEDGSRRSIRSQDINEYIRTATGSPFTSKHFRTWGGTVLATGTLATVALPETQSARRKALVEAIDQVAGHLGNTRSVCRACYIHPAVLSSWEEGLLDGRLAAARRSFRKVPPGLEQAEMVVLRMLEQLEPQR